MNMGALFCFERQQDLKLKKARAGKKTIEYRFFGEWCDGGTEMLCIWVAKHSRLQGNMHPVIPI